MPAAQPAERGNGYGQQSRRDHDQEPAGHPLGQPDGQGGAGRVERMVVDETGQHGRHQIGERGHRDDQVTGPGPHRDRPGHGAHDQARAQHEARFAARQHRTQQPGQGARDDQQYPEPAGPGPPPVRVPAGRWPPRRGLPGPGGIPLARIPVSSYVVRPGHTAVQRAGTCIVRQWLHQQLLMVWPAKLTDGEVRVAFGAILASRPQRGSGCAALRRQIGDRVARMAAADRQRPARSPVLAL